MDRYEDVVGNNYAEITGRFSPFRRKYVYIDTTDLDADKIFAAAKLRIGFEGTYYKPDEKYCFVICNVRRKDDEKFKKCLDKLYSKMIISGRKDYKEVFNKIIVEFIKNY